MRGVRYDRILASTALALILAAPAGFAFAANDTPVALDAAVPMPSEPAMGAPTAADIAVQPAETTGTVPAPVQMVAPAAEAVAPDPLASLDPADRPIAEKVHEMLAAKVDKIFTNRKEKAAVEAFYENRNSAPMWIEKGVMNARASKAIARLKLANADGLDVNDYRVPDFSAQSPDLLAEAELRMTATVLTYARHVQAGRFPYSRISQNIEVPQAPPDTAEVLTKMADARDAANALDEFSPTNKEYKLLKAKLAELRNKNGGNNEQIADGPVLKLNPKAPMEDPRVPHLRERLGMGDTSDQRYDAKVADAVKKYQQKNDLKATGQLDAATIRELNGPAHDKQIDIVLANMERLRWLPRDLGKTYVMVNLPDFRLKVMSEGEQVWTTRVVIGKTSMPTPILFAQMKYITINPTWNVPQSIVQNEYLPALAQDPTVLQRMGLRVEHERDGTVHITQPPGDGNALGHLRFNFPNRFSVYQHDTPDKQLFGLDRRAFSHGCMRVQDPPKYAEVLLNLVRPNDHYTAERIRHMYGTMEQDIQFPTFIPVNITYQTAFVDDSGKLEFRSDVYGLDGRMISAIKSERGMVEMAAKDKDREREPVANAPAGAGGKKRVAQQIPQPQRTGGFFESLFGGGANAAAPPRPVPGAPVRRTTR